MKKIADGEDWAMPATIDDPAILDEIGEALKGRGLASALRRAERAGHCFERGRSMQKARIAPGLRGRSTLLLVVLAAA